MQYEKTYRKLDMLKQIGNIKISHCRGYHLLKGNPLYNIRFTDIEKFHYPGLAPVTDQSGSYHINFNGVGVYEKRFDKTFGFYCNRAAVIDNGNYYHIDPKGKKIYQDSYDWLGNYQEDKCVVNKAGKFFHIDLEGNKIYQEEYDYVGDFKDDIAVVYKNGQATHINVLGKKIHNKWYKKLGIYHKGYANAEDGSGWFHINIKGDSIYQHRYKMVEPFYNGYAKVETFSGTLGQIDLSGDIKNIIYQPDTISQMHQTSAEMVGFWNTYLLNAAAHIGILELLPDNLVSLTKKLGVNQHNLQRFLRALWEIKLISYDNNKDIWKLIEKGQFFIDSPFIIKAAKMWGRVIAEENWLKIPKLLNQHEISSRPSFKEEEENVDVKTDLYETLVWYTNFDIAKFKEIIDIDKSHKILLFGVHSLALVDILKSQNINSICYHNDPEIPEKLTDKFNINIIGKDDSIDQYNVAIFGRFLQHQDDNKVLSYLKNLKDSNISRILLIETIIEENSPMGGAIDINIMVETGGMLRSKNHWEYILNKVGNFSINNILPLTSYLSVIDIRRK